MCIKKRSYYSQWGWQSGTRFWLGFPPCRCSCQLDWLTSRERRWSWWSRPRRTTSIPRCCPLAALFHQNTRWNWNHNPLSFNHRSYIDPRGRPTVTASSDHCFSTCRPFVRPSVRPSVPTFQNNTNFKRKQCSLLARLWVWPSGSLMTHVLFYLNS